MIVPMTGDTLFVCDLWTPDEEQADELILMDKITGLKWSVSVMSFHPMNKIVDGKEIHEKE